MVADLILAERRYQKYLRELGGIQVTEGNLATGLVADFLPSDWTLTVFDGGIHALESDFVSAGLGEWIVKLLVVGTDREVYRAFTDDEYRGYL